MAFVIEEIVKSYGDKDVLKGASFQFEEGKIYGLLGRNGAGKTTLFNLLNRDAKMEEGTFYFAEGENKREVSPEEIGYVLSTPVVPEFLTGREFLEFICEIHYGRRPDQGWIGRWFSLVGIEKEDQNRIMKNYSHGMKNKMQMLSTILFEPKVLLLDEPMTSLDVVVAEEMKELLRTIKENRTIIMSTHILDLALDMCDEIVLLHEGKLTPIRREEVGIEEFRSRIIEALKEEQHG